MKYSPRFQSGVDTRPVPLLIVNLKSRGILFFYLVHNRGGPKRRSWTVYILLNDLHLIALCNICTDKAKKAETVLSAFIFFCNVIL